MRYIIQTSLSGSTMLVLYLAVKFCLGKRMSNRRKQLMLKVTVLFCPIPLAVLNQYLVDHVNIVRKVLWNDGKITLYTALQCRLCGNVVVGDIMGSSYLKVCPH